eukprot:SAG31_NODE_31535_length_367_cov_0.582090_1_plen_66_part_00
MDDVAKKPVQRQTAKEAAKKKKKPKNTLPKNVHDAAVTLGKRAWSVKLEKNMFVVFSIIHLQLQV